MTEAQTTPIFELGLFCLFVCFLSQLHKCKVLWPLLQWFWRHSAKCFLGKTCHSEAILASYFRLTRPGSYLNEWGENQNFTFNGHRTVACIDSWIKSDKKKKRLLATLLTGFTSTVSQHQLLLELIPPEHLNKCKFSVCCLDNLSWWSWTSAWNPPLSCLLEVREQNWFKNVLNLNCATTQLPDIIPRSAVIKRSISFFFFLLFFSGTHTHTHTQWQSCWIRTYYPPVWFKCQICAVECIRMF